MLMQPDLREVLRANALFAVLEEGHFQRVADATQPIQLDAGQVLFQRGDPAHAFFVVASGQVKLFMQSREGNEKIVELENPGQCFAEAIMFMQGAAYPVSAAATEPTTVLSIPAREFLWVLKQDLPACLRMLAVLSQRLHSKIREIEELTLENAATRLVWHLVRRATADTSGRLRVHFEESRQMLASQLAIKPETLSRLIRSLSESGLIETDGRDIVIVDPARLRQRYGGPSDT